MNQFNNEEFRTPSGSEYDPAIENSIRRRQRFDYENGMLIAESIYTVGGMKYKVRSIFDTERSKSSEEGLKRLMVQEIDKVS